MLLDYELDSRTAKGVAREIGRLITSGSLPAGTRLPTIRTLATELCLSPTTISHAYKMLAQSGMVTAKGKLGTIVSGHQSDPTYSRFAAITSTVSSLTQDLTSGTPDPDLLPDLGPALASLADKDAAALTTGYLEQPVLPELEGELVRRWPFEPEAITLVDGALDAIDRLFRQLLRFGDRVLVENPTFPPMLDLIERVGAEAIGLRLDDEGIVPASLADALKVNPAVLVLQPRAHNPCGVSMTSGRMRELADILRSSSVLVIEDDHAGGISTAPQVSLGSVLPDMVVRVLSFSKAFGPDLRLAAVGGAHARITSLDRHRTLGPGWSSRLLQHVLLHLLTDDRTLASLGVARHTYAQRRHALIDALRRRGVEVSGEDGINIWVSVADEHQARTRLASRGVAVALGSQFLSAPLTSDHIRITCSTIASDYEDLAEMVADAARDPRLNARHPIITR